MNGCIHDDGNSFDMENHLVIDVVAISSSLAPTTQLLLSIGDGSSVTHIWIAARDPITRFLFLDVPRLRTVQGRILESSQPKLGLAIIHDAYTGRVGLPDDNRSGVVLTLAPENGDSAAVEVTMDIFWIQGSSKAVVMENHDAHVSYSTKTLGSLPHDVPAQRLYRNHSVLSVVAGGSLTQKPGAKYECDLQIELVDQKGKAVASECLLRCVGRSVNERNVNLTKLVQLPKRTLAPRAVWNEDMIIDLKPLHTPNVFALITVLRSKEDRKKQFHAVIPVILNNKPVPVYSNLVQLQEGPLNTDQGLDVQQSPALACNDISASAEWPFLLIKLKLLSTVTPSDAAVNALLLANPRNVTVDMIENVLSGDRDQLLLFADRVLSAIIATAPVVGGPSAIYAAKLLALIASESPSSHATFHHLGKVTATPRHLPALVQSTSMQDHVQTDALLQAAASVLKENGISAKLVASVLDWFIALAAVSHNAPLPSVPLPPVPSTASMPRMSVSVKIGLLTCLVPHSRLSTSPLTPSASPLLQPHASPVMSFQRQGSRSSLLLSSSHLPVPHTSPQMSPLPAPPLPPPPPPPVRPNTTTTQPLSVFPSRLSTGRGAYASAGSVSVPPVPRAPQSPSLASVAASQVFSTQTQLLEVVQTAVSALCLYISKHNLSAPVTGGLLKEDPLVEWLELVGYAKQTFIAVLHHIEASFDRIFVGALQPLLKLVNPEVTPTVLPHQSASILRLAESLMKLPVLPVSAVHPLVFTLAQAANSCVHSADRALVKSAREALDTVAGLVANHKEWDPSVLVPLFSTLLLHAPNASVSAHGHIHTVLAYMDIQHVRDMITYSSDALRTSLCEALLKVLHEKVALWQTKIVTDVIDPLFPKLPPRAVIYVIGLTLRCCMESDDESSAMKLVVLMKNCVESVPPMPCGALERCVPALCTLLLHPNARVSQTALHCVSRLVPQLPGDLAVLLSLSGLWAGFKLMHFSNDNPPDSSFVDQWESTMLDAPSELRSIAGIVMDALCGSVEEALSALRTLATICAGSSLQSITVQCLSEIARLGASTSGELSAAQITATAVASAETAVHLLSEVCYKERSSSSGSSLGGETDLVIAARAMLVAAGACASAVNKLSL